jgi:hypothetical protein
MTPAAKARLTTYLTGAAGFGGLILAGMGLAEFDSATGMIDLAPFNVYALVAAIPTALAVVVAPVALIKGWRK